MPSGQGGARPAPAHPPDEQVDRDQQDQRQDGGPDDRGGAHQQARRRRARQRRRITEQQHRERADHQHHGQQVGHDQVLDHDLFRIEQDRHRGQRRAPGGQAVVTQHRVHHRGHAQAQEMLDGGHEDKGVERQQQPQEQGVAAGIDHIRRQVDGAPQVVERVQPEQHRRPVAQHHHQPGHHREQQGQREQPVAADQAGDGGQRVPAARCRRPGRFGGWLARPAFAGAVRSLAEIFPNRRHPVVSLAPLCLDSGASADTPRPGAVANDVADAVFRHARPRPPWHGGQAPGENGKPLQNMPVTFLAGGRTQWALIPRAPPHRRLAQDRTTSEPAWPSRDLCRARSTVPGHLTQT